MKRDMDLCRRILLELEGIDFGPGLIELSYDDVEQNIVFYHVKLLDEAGLIEAVDLSKVSRSRWRVKSLTWAGHDFLEAIEDEGNWEKAKSFIKESGKVITIETLKEAVKVLFL